MTILRRAKRLPAIAAVLTLAGGLVGGVALADNVKNDVVVGGTDTIVAGGNTTVSYLIQDTGNTCDAADGSPANVTINAPAGVTTSPSSLSFTSCNSPKPVVFSSSNVGQHEVTVSVSDANGDYNPAPAKFTLKVNAAPTPSDTTAPVITPEISGTVGSGGWYTSDVALTWSVFDAESAISSTSGCDPVAIKVDQQSTNYTCTAKSAGGADSKTVSIKRDATAPVVSVTGVTNGATYTLGSVPPAGCSTSDAMSDVATAATLSSSGGPVGSITATCSGAKDNAGNTGSASATYSVVYAFDGFFRPIDNGALNVAKAGSAIPVKFSLSGDQGLAIFKSGSPSSKPMTCDSGATQDPVEETVTAGSSSLSYDPISDQYTYVWKTDKAWTGCRQLTVSLIDGKSYTASFKFTK